MSAQNPSGQDALEKGRAAERAGDAKGAEDLYLQSAQQGNATAQYYVARWYIGQNLTLVTANDMAVVMSGKGDKFLNDPKFNVSAKEALRWAQKSADQGYSPAQELLGEIYVGRHNYPQEQDLVVPVDEGQALGWFIKAADKGNVTAQYAAGYLLEHGRAVMPQSTDVEGSAWHPGPPIAHAAGLNLKSAMEWYARAAAHGQEDAADCLLRLQDPGSDPRKAALREALAALDLEGDSAKTETLFRKADQLGGPDAPYFLGEILSRRAWKDFTSGAVSDALSGQTSKQSSACADMTAAFGRSSDQGNARASVALANSFLSGICAPADHATALFWFKKAGMQGSLSAADTTARMFEKGDGTAKDQAQALWWYHYAAERGDQPAKDALAAAPSTSSTTAPGPAKDQLQTIASWTRREEEGGRAEDSLTLKAGVLELVEVEFLGLDDKTGTRTSTSVKLTDVSRFDSNTFEGGDSDFGFVDPALRIGLTTRGDDVLRVQGESSRKRAGTPGFAVFEVSQKKLRDDTYARLCALINQKP